MTAPSLPRRPAGPQHPTRTGADAVVAAAAASPESRVAAQPRRLGWPRKLTAALIATDALAVALAIVAAHLARFGLDSAAERAAGGPSYTLLGLALGAGWMLALAALRTRERRIIGIGLSEYQRVANATLITFGAFAILAFLAKVDIARGYLAAALPAGLAVLLGGRIVWRRALGALRRGGRCLTGAILVGPPGDVARVAEELRRNLHSGYRPIAVSVTGTEAAEGAAAAGLPVIPSEELVAVSKQTRTRAVIIAGDLPGGRRQIRDLGWALENSQVELILVSRLIDVAGPRIHLRRLEGLPMVHVDLPQYSGFNHAAKRAFDVAVSALALALLAPVLAAVALAVKLDDGGPVLFRQERVGLRGTRFTMLKFRSMCVDAEARLAGLADRDEGNGMLFKIADDPRITRIGRRLRSASLDELPQLWNVLRGDMSLVGPRPPLPAEVARYEERVNRRLLTKPGVTGLWQVSGRSRLSWEESVKLDLYYVENWSMTSDLLILIRTVRAVVHRDGAF